MVFYRLKRQQDVSLRLASSPALVIRELFILRSSILDLPLLLKHPRAGSFVSTRAFARNRRIRLISSESLVRIDRKTAHLLKAAPRANFSRFE